MLIWWWLSASSMQVKSTYLEKDVDNARHEHDALPIHTNHYSHFHFVSHIQATVNADFIPRSINDWSSNSENDMSQRDIDIMIYHRSWMNWLCSISISAAWSLRNVPNSNLCLFSSEVIIFSCVWLMDTVSWLCCSSKRLIFSRNWFAFASDFEELSCNVSSCLEEIWRQYKEKIAQMNDHFVTLGSIWPACYPDQYGNWTTPNLGSDSEGFVPPDAAADSVCGEIFASGLRNPFRMGMDPNVMNKTLFTIGDVGAQHMESLYYGGTDYKGANYGW